MLVWVLAFKGFGFWLVGLKLGFNEPFLEMLVAI